MSTQVLPPSETVDNLDVAAQVFDHLFPQEMRNFRTHIEPEALIQCAYNVAVELIREHVKCARRPRITLAEFHVRFEVQPNSLLAYGYCLYAAAVARRHPAGQPTLSSVLEIVRDLRVCKNFPWEGVERDIIGAARRAGFCRVDGDGRYHLTATGRYFLAMEGGGND